MTTDAINKNLWEEMERLPGLVDCLAQTIENDFQITRKQLFGTRGSQKIATARAVFMSMLYWHTSMTLSEIGMITGGRDHTTVVSARKKIGREARKNPEAERYLDSLRFSVFGIKGKQTSDFEESSRPSVLKSAYDLKQRTT